MLNGFENIVEQRIRKALAEGKLDNLPGAGKPLKLEDDLAVPADLRMAYKILKNADCLPPEMELKKKIHQTEELLEGMAETQEKYRILKKLNYLIMKFNSISKRPIQFEMPQRYTEKFVGNCR